MSTNSSMDNAFLAMQTVLSIAPIPGVAACAVALQEIYKLVKNVALRQQECQALMVYASAVMKTIFDHHMMNPDAGLQSAITKVEIEVADMRNDIKKWRAYGKGMGYLKNQEIQECIRAHRVALDTALNMVGLAHALEQTQWNQKFMDAQAHDAELLQNIGTRQEEMIEMMQQLQQLLIKQEPQTQQDVNMTAPNREVAMKQLFRLRSTRQDSAVLPFRELRDEIQKSGQRAMHAGSTYDIWKGIWLDEHVVALKVFRGTNPSERDATRLNRQIDLWRTLHHPNILQLLGICRLDGGNNAPLYFVSPWMPNRDVMAYLEKHPEADRLKLLHDVVKGLLYLHSVSILHGGLQGSNVLVDKEGNAVLSDFSLSKLMDPNVLFTHSNGPQSSLRWMAPEAHNQQAMSSKTDVYSWGMTALQIISGLVPFYKIKAVGKVVIAIAIRNVKPERNDYIQASPLLQDDRIWNLLSSCWASDPEKRPTVEEIFVEVASLRGVPVEL